MDERQLRCRIYCIIIILCKKFAYFNIWIQPFNIFINNSWAFRNISKRWGFTLSQAFASPMCVLRRFFGKSHILGQGDLCSRSVDEAEDQWSVQSDEMFWSWADIVFADRGKGSDPSIFSSFIEFTSFMVLWILEFKSIHNN